MATTQHSEFGRFARWLGRCRPVLYASILLLNAVAACAVPHPCPASGEQELPAFMSLQERSELALSVQWTRDGASSEIVVDGMAYPQQVCRVGADRLLLAGSRHGLKTALLLEIGARKVLRAFWANETSISPDRRWMFVVQHVPAQIRGSVADEYYLYDLTQSVSAAESADVRPSTPPGVRVYPNESVLASGEINLLASDALFWEPGSRHVLFAYGIEKSQITIAIMELATGSRPVMRTRVVKTTDVCAHPPVDPSDDWIRLNRAQFLGGSGSPTGVRLTFGAYVGCEARPLTLAVDQDFH